MPRPSSSRSTRLTVAREVPARPARSSWRSGIDRLAAARRVDLRQLGETAQHAPVGREVERLEQVARQAAHLAREERDEHLRDARVLAAEALEVGAVDGARLARLEGLDGGAAPAVRVEQGQLPERLPRPEHRQHRDVRQSRLHPHGEAPAHDEVQRVRRVAHVEHDLAPPERAPSRDRQHALHVAVGHAVEEGPFHGPGI